MENLQIACVFDTVLRLYTNGLHDGGPARDPLLQMVTDFLFKSGKRFITTNWDGYREMRQIYCKLLEIITKCDDYY